MSNRCKSELKVDKLPFSNGHKGGTVGAMCDYIIKNLYGGDLEMYPVVFKDVQKIISSQYSVDEDEISLFIKIDDFER